MLNEFDARAVGRGNAASATDSDPSSIFYNIGGLAVAEGTHVMIGGSLIAPIASFTQADGNKIDSNTSPQVVPAFFASTRLSDLVAVGIGFYTPFGLAMSWPDNSPTNDVLHSQSLRTYFITPSVGVNLDKYVPGLTARRGRRHRAGDRRAPAGRLLRHRSRQRAPRRHRHRHRRPRSARCIGRRRCPRSRSA